MIPYMRRNLARKRLALAQADAVIAVSSVIGGDLRARVPELAGTRLEIIPNPVDIESIRANAGGAPPLDAPYAIYAGKLAPNKGARWLIDVACESRVPWPMVIVGDGPDRPTLERAARSSGVDARFLGWRPRDETLRWLAHATVVVFPSHGPESLSRVLLESSALGRAIAAMDTGGTRDILADGRTALLSTSPHELARHVAQLVADAALRERLGNAARAHVQAHFDAPAVVARVEALYRDLLARSPGRHAA
jgi:glycosyltransferase involved in cell wall biosynthesis